VAGARWVISHASVNDLLNHCQVRERLNG